MTCVACLEKAVAVANKCIQPSNIEQVEGRRKQREKLGRCDSKQEAPSVVRHCRRPRAGRRRGREAGQLETCSGWLIPALGGWALSKWRLVWRGWAAGRGWAVAVAGCVV